MFLASSVLALVLTAAPAPRAWKHAETIVHVPAVEAAQPVRAWFELAGRRALLLRPTTWVDAFHPLLRVDPTQPAEMAAVGLASSGAVTISQDPRTHVACAGVGDAAKFQKLADEKLATLGAVERTKEKSHERVLARREGKAVAGYAITAKQVCAFSARAGSQSLVEDIVPLTTKPPPGKNPFAGLDGSVFLLTRDGITGVDAKGALLTADARLSSVPVAGLLPAGDSPYGVPGGDAALTARARLKKSDLTPVVGRLGGMIARACATCDEAALSQAARSLAPLLTGQVLMHVTRFGVRESLKTPLGRLDAAKHALLAETSAPEKVRATLRTLAKQRGAKETEDGLELTLGRVVLRVGVQGRHVYFSNDADALTAALAAIAPAKLPSGAVFTVNPKLVAAGLSQISFLDAMGGGKDAGLLAGLFAASTEFGPFLASSERVEGTLDAVGSGDHHLKLRWTLTP